MINNELDEIYKSFMQDIYRYILHLCGDKYIAEDIVQETFFRAYLHFESCPKSAIKPWLFRVAYNCFIDFKRKDARKQVEDSSFFEGITSNLVLEDEVVNRESIREIRNIIKELPEKQGQAVILCDFSGMSYNDAAMVLEVSLAHFKVLLFRGRQAIRLKIERKDNLE